MSTEREASDILDPIDESGTRPLPPIDTLGGMEVRDASGERVGSVADAYTDTTGTFVRYLAVATGWFGTRRHMVPVDDVHLANDGAGDYLVLPYDAERLKQGPSSEEADEVTHAHEQGIYAHYGRAGYWDAVRARQTPPAPTPEIAQAEVADAIRRGEDPNGVAVKRWGV